MLLPYRSHNFGVNLPHSYKHRIGIVIADRTNEPLSILHY